jgi:hypothetical protein
MRGTGATPRGIDRPSIRQNADAFNGQEGATAPGIRSMYAR